MYYVYVYFTTTVEQADEWITENIKLNLQAAQLNETDLEQQHQSMHIIK